MTKKTKYLIVLNIILIAAISFSLKKNTSSSTLNRVDTQFALSDSSVVHRIVLGEQTFVKQENATWRINERYQVDERRMRSLLALLQRVSIKRPASEAIKAQVQQEIRQSGFPVQTFDVNGQELQRFRFIAKDGETYAAHEEANPYIIHVPGVSLNLANWFTANETSWRNRQVIQTTWRTLKNMDVSYKNDPSNSFQITFADNFYNVPGISQLDSAAVYDYLLRIQEFKVSRFIADRPNLADSLALLQPLCSIGVQDLYSERDNTLSIYPTNETLYGVLEKGKEVVEISPRALESIMVPKAAFEKK
ncbi:MAG: DUF4340 domain-containing protein [Flammeovirgaceae bacterium]